MKKNIIALVFYKLKTTDSVLPLLMELCERNPGARPWVVFPDLETRERVRRNEHLWAALEFVGARTEAVRRETLFLSACNLLRLFILWAFSRNVFLKFGDPLPRHVTFMRWLRRVSRVLEVKCFLPPHPARQLKAKYAVACYKRKLRNQPLVVDFLSEEHGSYDYIATTITPELYRDVYGLTAPRDKMLHVGYIRALPKWREFLDRLVAEAEHELERPYALFVVGGLTRFSDVIDEPSQHEMFANTLRGLAKYQEHFRLVLKPHAETKVEDIEAVCREVGLTNWTISYRHPMVLASRAEFVVSYYYSNTFLDAFYLGKPVVEFNQRRTEMVEARGGRSSALEYCDFFTHKDQEKFEADIARLVSGDYTLDRGPELMEEGFPEMGTGFFDVIGGFLQRGTTNA